MTRSRTSILLLLGAAAACSSSTNPAEEKSGAASSALVAFEPAVDGDVLVASVTGLAPGEPLFVPVARDGARPIEASWPADADPKVNPRLHFPDGIAALAPNPKARMRVRLCSGDDAKTNVSACLDEGSPNAWEDYFDGEPPDVVAHAVLEALAVITLADRVPGCYQDALARTEAFEKSVAGIDVAAARAALAKRLQGPFTACKAVPRASWASTPGCNDPTLVQLERDLDGALASALAKDPTAVAAYDERFLLARRLGVDEVAGAPYRGGEISLSSPSPAALGANALAQCDGSLGDARCLFGPDLLRALLPHSDPNARDVLALASSDAWRAAHAPVGSVPTTAGLLYAAMRFAKYTQLAPKAAVDAYEAQWGYPRCADVVAYFAPQRLSYLPELADVRATGALVPPAKSTRGVLKTRVEATAQEAVSGDDLVVPTTACGGGPCGAALVGDGDAFTAALAPYSRLRVRMRKSYATTLPDGVLKEIDLSDWQSGKVTTDLPWLSGADTRALVDGHYDGAAVQLEGCRADCSTDGGNLPAWELVASYRFRPSNGCADGTVEDTFTSGMVGCAGTATWDRRASLCGPGYKVADAFDWNVLSASAAPHHHYWTDSEARFQGVEGACTVSLISGHSCPTNQPMRVCSDTRGDPEGNQCNWVGCNWEGGSDPLHYGGCFGNATAGAVCVPKSTARQDACVNGGGCGDHETCTPTGAKTRRCDCAPHYARNAAGQCAGIDLCAQSGYCGATATCASTGPETATCTPCDNGQVAVNNVCVDACTVDNGGCAPQASCAHGRANVVSCRCNYPYEGNGNVCYLNRCASPATNTCSPHGDCHDRGQEQYDCSCHAGWTGDGRSCSPQIGPTLPWRGGDGGHNFDDNQCNAEDIAVGIFGMSGKFINRLGLVCAHLRPNGTEESRYRTGPFGGKEASPFDVQCPTGFYMNGWNARSHTYFDGVDISCATRWGNGNYVEAHAGGYDGDMHYDYCPSGFGIYRVDVHYVDWVDAEQAYCRYALP